MVKRFIINSSLVLLFFIGLSRLLAIQVGHLELVSSLIAYPFLRVQNAVVSSLEKRRTRREIATSLIHDLQQSLMERERLQKENIELKALLQYQESTKDIRNFLSRYSSDDALVTHILLKHFDGQQFYLIDSGSSAGIEKDMIAVYKDCLVGRVIEVYPYYSKVLLLSDPSCKVAAVCAQTNTKGIHEGINRLDATRLNFVHHLDTVTEGDLVLSSGEGLVFPRGFGLGRIKQIDTDGFNYTITLAPLIDFKKLEYCCILKNSAQLLPDSGENELADANLEA